jgi:hypothetical protein
VTECDAQVVWTLPAPHVSSPPPSIRTHLADFVELNAATIPSYLSFVELVATAIQPANHRIKHRRN